MKNDKTIKRFESSGGVRVYKLPVEAFPNHVTNCYLVLDDPVTLLDAASGWEMANKDLFKCFETLRSEFGEKITIKDVDRLIVTHGHIDHFGGVNFMADQAAPKLGIHELDVSVIRHFKERLLITATNLRLFLDRSGISQAKAEALVEMNKWSKDTFKEREVDFTFDEGPVRGGQLVAHHTPGHCPGQVCLKLHDILFTADHVLSRITPNQSPESVTRYNGLGHYLESLRKIRRLDGIRLALGGHEDEMEDIYKRIDDTITFHDARLNKTREILSEPKTIDGVSRELFGERVDYHALLAMLEAGAHVEYLYERGQVRVVNIEEVEREFNPVLVYQAW